MKDNSLVVSDLSDQENEEADSLLLSCYHRNAVYKQTTDQRGKIVLPGQAPCCC